MSFSLGKVQIKVLGFRCFDYALPRIVHLCNMNFYLPVKAVSVMHEDCLLADLPQNCTIQETVQGNTVEKCLSDDGS